MRIIGTLLLALVVMGGGAWLLRDRIPGLWTREPVEISPEAAAAAEEKLERLQAEGEPVRLSSVEVSSLLQYRSPAWAAERVDRPEVEFASDTLRLSGTIATDRLPSHPDLDRVRVLLPDSSRISVTGRLRSLQPGRVALDIRGVEFAGIPIPSRYYPEVLKRLGRSEEPGLPPTALALPLPRGVTEARVEGSHLVLLP